MIFDIIIHKFLWNISNHLYKQTNKYRIHNRPRQIELNNKASIVCRFCQSFYLKIQKENAIQFSQMTSKSITNRIMYTRRNLPWLRLKATAFSMKLMVETFSWHLLSINMRPFTHKLKRTISPCHWYVNEYLL